MRKMKKIKATVRTLTQTIFILFALSFSLSAPVFAQAAPAITPEKQAVCDGINLTGGTNSCDPAAAGTGITDLVANIISIFSYVIGVAALIMIMVGGFKYITSQGDANSISSAKNTILYAVIGLVVALFAQLIVRFVINRV